jgi:hypothetical protein
MADTLTADIFARLISQRAFEDTPPLPPVFDYAAEDSWLFAS